MPPVQRVCDHLDCGCARLDRSSRGRLQYEYVNLDCGWTTGCNCALLYVLIFPDRAPRLTPAPRDAFCTKSG
eukprot:7352639-Prymnesium_polylepis.1